MHVKAKKWMKCPKKKLHGKCFLPEICQDLNRLTARYEQTVTQNKRLCRLAMPRQAVSKYEPSCPKRFSRDLELIPVDEVQQTRTVQLAYPPVRKLLLQKAQFKAVLGEERIFVLNKTIRKSLFSFYSRLENVQPPKERIPIPKWTKRQWRRHGRYFRRLARPKKLPKIPSEKPIWKPIEEMKRYHSLAIPKKRLEYIKPAWNFSLKMKTYVPTDRTLKLSIIPAKDYVDHNRPLPIVITPGAMKYKPSPRVIELSTPQKLRQRDDVLKEDPFGVAANALIYKASKRTKELAEPREYENIHERKEAFQVSPRALKAKASPRTKELAVPVNKK